MPSVEPRTLKPSAQMVSMVHLKHIGPHGIRALGHIFTGSMATSTIPTIWQKSIIVPFLKLGGTHPETSSYCPISLLCPSAPQQKSPETLRQHLRTTIHQHVFQPRHSTVTALNEILTAPALGFNACVGLDYYVLDLRGRKIKTLQWNCKSLIFQII